MSDTAEAPVSTFYLAFDPAHAAHAEAAARATGFTVLQVFEGSGEEAVYGTEMYAMQDYSASAAVNPAAKLDAEEMARKRTNVAVSALRNGGAILQLALHRGNGDKEGLTPSEAWSSFQSKMSELEREQNYNPGLFLRAWDAIVKWRRKRSAERPSRAWK